jgi:hypothetical protein
VGKQPDPRYSDKIGYQLNRIIRGLTKFITGRLERDIKKDDDDNNSNGDFEL